MADDVEVLAGELGLDELCAFVAGVDVWSTPGSERLGIGGLVMTDGPNGARGSRWAGPRAACFPCGSALGATWDEALVRQVGEALGVETRRKGAHLLLAPTVNLHRHPLGGRHFECMSEDPHLTARLAVAYVQGVQSQGVGTTIKHFVANDTEFERMTISSDVDERTLRESYLAPFEAAVTEAGTWAVMSSYNRVNGTYAAHHRELLHQVLREEWGFDGLVVSDWFGTYATVPSALAGLDVEMPGPPIHWGRKLAEAVRAGEVPEDVVRAKARNVMRTLQRAGALHSREPRVEQEVDDPAIRSLIRTAGAAAMVLLRNEGGLLPLQPSALQTVAVVGPNAMTAQIQGGGSAAVSPHDAVSPLQGLRAALEPHGVAVVAERGCTTHKRLPAVDRTVLADDMVVTYADTSGREVLTETFAKGHFLWFGPFHPAVPERFTARAEAELVADETGEWTFSLVVSGRARLHLDGALLVDAWDTQGKSDAFFGNGSQPVTATVPLEAGARHRLVAEYSTERSHGMGGLTIGFLRPTPPDLFERAVTAAAQADVAVVVVGTNDDWESEGHDRASLALPGRQAELVRAVAAVNPRTVVVLNCGSPVDVSWATEVPAVVLGWFAGQEWGNALADVLLGVADPGGRLPTTWPARIEDTPAFTTYPGDEGHVRYGEGLCSGHRWYDARHIEPAFCFGHGLSYTTFTHTAAAATPASGGRAVDVRVTVTNTGERAGWHVVQCYVSRTASAVSQPPSTLRAFAKVHLEPGAAREVRLHVPERALSYWSVREHTWVFEPGEVVVRLGSSSRDLPVALHCTVGGA